MLVPVEASVVFSLLLCTATQQQQAHRRPGAAGDFNGSRPRKDAWLKDLLKYDFENRIWDVSWSANNGVYIDNEITGHVRDKHRAKARGGHHQNVMLNETFTNEVGNHDLLSLEHSKKVNAYFVDTQWDSEKARWTDQLALANQHLRSPVLSVPQTVSTDRADIGGDPSRSKKKQPYSDGYISSENWKTLHAMNFNRRPQTFNNIEENAFIAPVLGSQQTLETPNNEPNNYSNHIIEETEEEYIASPSLNHERYKTRKSQQSFTAQHHPSSQDRSHLDQHSAAVNYQHNGLNSPDSLKRKNRHRYIHNKSHKKQGFGGYPKRLYRKPYKVQNLKQNKSPDQVTSGSQTAIDRRQVTSGSQPAIDRRRPEVRQPGQGHRLRPTACRGPSCRRVDTFSRPSSPLLAVGAVLLVGTLAALGYLIWLTPPTVVVYSKRQRDSSSGADLLAAPFELSQLTELAAQLGQALAEAELVALKLSADGGRQADRWRRCQPLQLCRALVEGAVIHQQPVWSRYIRAAPWLWLFGLDSSTAARLQELAHRPDFRSCRPFFRSCTKFQ